MFLLHLPANVPLCDMHGCSKERQTGDGYVVQLRQRGAQACARAHINQEQRANLSGDYVVHVHDALARRTPRVPFVADKPCWRPQLQGRHIVARQRQHCHDEQGQGQESLAWQLFDSFHSGKT
jgi:hypothetical protein